MNNCILQELSTVTVQKLPYYSAVVQFRRLLSTSTASAIHTNTEHKVLSELPLLNARGGRIVGAGGTRPTVLEAKAGVKWLPII